MANDDNTIPNPPQVAPQACVAADCGGKPENPDLFAGRYKIEPLLGEGAMSRVYKGVDASLNRLVAIKKMLPQYLNREFSRQRFQREAVSIAALDHPNKIIDK